MVSIWRRKAVVVVLISAVLLGGAVMSIRQVGLQNSLIQKYVGQTETIEFQITTDPTKTAPKLFGTALAPPSFSFLATAVTVGRNGEKFSLRVPIRVIASTSKVLSLLPGQKIRATGEIKRAKEARVAAMFLARGQIKVLSPASRWAKSLGAVRTRLRDLSPPDNAGSLIPGMVLGDTSLQSAEFKNAMRRSGLTHLVAVSGANFAIISLFVLWCMQWIFRSKRIRLIFTTLALLAFIALVRPSPSVLRAAAMASVVLFAKGFGRRSDPLPALGFAIAVVVIGDPWQGREPGFALSVLATAGLLLLAPKISFRLSIFIPKSIAGALSPPMAAVIMCAPVLIALSGYLGLMTVVANLLVAPVVAPITVVGLIAALVSGVSPGVSSFLLALIHLPAAWIAGVANWSARFPVLQLSTGLFGFLMGLTLLALVVLTIALSKRWRRIFVVSVLVAALIFAWITRWPGSEWDIANCDVGQGDSMVINLGNHRGIVIDAGPDAQLVDRCLSSLGVKTIPVLVLTHFHADHVAGLAGLIRNRRVGQVWVSNHAVPILESRKVRGLLKDVPVIEVLRGTTSQIMGKRGMIRLKVLWPDLSLTDPDYFSEDGKAINNSSVALEIRSKDFTLFAGGDVEPESQRALLPLNPIDIYKVSHHGSAYQDLDFMSQLSPEISLISVGIGNTYGHPSAQTVAALVRLGSQVYRTDTEGAIAIVARRHIFSVRTSGGVWWKKVRLS